MTLRERIKKLCKNKGISLNQLELNCGFAKGYLSKLDKSTPNTKKIQTIADYFNVTVEYLMTGDNTSPYSDDMAEMVSQIRNDVELSKALTKYFTLSDDKKKHVVELINLLSEV